MTAGNDELVRSMFDAFLRGDLDALSSLMDPAVQWLCSEPGDWDCHDRDEVLARLRDRHAEGGVTDLTDSSQSTSASSSKSAAAVPTRG